MSHAGIESELIVKCCNEQRKEWKIWLQKRNSDWDKEFEDRLESWNTGNWFYRLMFTKPVKGKDIKELSFQMNKIHHDDAMDRIEDLEALAAKSIDGIVMLDTKDARFLHINE